MENKYKIWCIVFNFIWSMIICKIQKPDHQSAIAAPGKDTSWVVEQTTQNTFNGHLMWNN